MILILADAHDQVARSWRSVLASATNLPVQIVTTAELVYSRGLTHWIGDNRVEAHVHLCRFGTLSGFELAGVINRVVTLPEAHLVSVKRDDRSYVSQEMQAVIASWLMALSCPVLNRPSATFTAGPLLSQAAWENLASSAGLSVPERALDLDSPEPPALHAHRRTVVLDRRV